DIGQQVMVVKDKRIYGDVQFVGEDFLQVFSFPLLGGDAGTALKGSSPSVVITESTASSLFGKEPALNKMVRFGSDFFKVTAVVRDLPRNSSFHFDYLLPFSDVARDPGIK